MTRARKQLWFLETSKELTAPIVEALEQNANPALVEVVRQTNKNIAEKLAVLRAGATTDPKLWGDSIPVHGKIASTRSYEGQDVEWGGEEYEDE